MIDIYAVYDHPSDYPDGYVVRIWNSGHPHKEPYMSSDDLEEVREALKAKFLKNIGRFIEDDPVIIECWI